MSLCTSVCACAATLQVCDTDTATQHCRLNFAVEELTVVIGDLHCAFCG